MSLDIAKAVAHALAKAHPMFDRATCGYCARAVREALIAGGAPLPASGPSACNYGPILEKLGFVADLPGRKVGDIAVFEAYPGNPYGHIQIWCGEYWVSDFIQRRPGVFPAERQIWPGPIYERLKVKHKFYRWLP